MSPTSQACAKHRGKLQGGGTYSLADPTRNQWLMTSSQSSIYVMTPAAKKRHVSERVPVELYFDHLRARLLSSYWMGHICRTWKKKNGNWSLGLLLFSPKASFPKAGPSKADQFPNIRETEDRGAAGEGAGRGCCLERRGVLGGGPPERASAGGSCGGSPGHCALCFPRCAFRRPAPPS